MWFRKSAEQGHPESQCYVGIEYVSHSGGGWGDEPDDVEAAKWLRKAAEQGNPKAQPWLSRCDERIAKTLALRMLAIQGDAEAQFKLAWCYYHGDGAHPDRIEALAFWILLGTTDKKGKWGTYAPHIGFCKSDMSPGAIAKGEQRAKELRKEIDDKIAAKKAAK
jgi:Sel1 repeat